MKHWIVTFAMIFLSACASMNRIDLVDNNTTQVKSENSHQVNVNTVHVNKVNETVYVNGRVTRNNNQRFTKAYVTVDLYNENGVRVDSIDAKVSFKRNGARASRSGRFSAQLEEIPEKNSSIVVQAHDKRKPSTGDGTLKVM